MDYDYIANRIEYCINIIQNEYQKVANKYNITFNTLKTLELLSKESKTQTEICMNLHLAKSTIHSVISNLEKTNLIEMIEKNEKEKAVSLTEEGLQYINPILKDIKEVKEKLIKRINDEDLLHILNASFKLNG